MSRRSRSWSRGLIIGDWKLKKYSSGLMHQEHFEGEEDSSLYDREEVLHGKVGGGGANLH